MATYTQTQYNSLVAAIATGTTRVKYGDKDVTYRDLTEMLELKRLMEQDLGIGEFAPPKTGRRRRYASYSKGID